MISIKTVFMSLLVATFLAAAASASSLTYTGGLSSPDDNGSTVSTFTPFETGVTAFDVYEIDLFAGGFNAGDVESLLVGIYDGSNGTPLDAETLSFTDLGTEMEYFVYLSTPQVLAPSTTYWLGVTNQNLNPTNTTRWYKTASASDFTSPEGVTVTTATDYYTGGIANVPPTFATATAFELNSPEPSALLLAGFGLACVLGVRFRRIPAVISRKR